MAKRILAGVLASAMVLGANFVHNRAADHSDDRVCYAQTPNVAKCGTPDTLPENVIVFPPSAVTR